MTVTCPVVAIVAPILQVEPTIYCKIKATVTIIVPVVANDKIIYFQT